MSGRAARVTLVIVAITTSTLAIRYYDGHDFVYNVWTPIHALLAGQNPYDPTNSAYFQRYHVPVAAGPYVPAALLIHAPLALLSPSRSADVMAVVNAALIWLGVLVLIPPWTPAGCVAASAAGALVVLSAAAAHTIELGQLSGWAFAGLAMFAGALRRNPKTTWLPAIGTVLVALKPQSGIPMLLALAVLGNWKVLARAAGVLVITSTPGALLFMVAAGSLPAVVRSLHDNVISLSSLPPTSLGSTYNLRIDGLGVISHLGGPPLTGIGWTLLFLIVGTVLFGISVRSWRGRSTTKEVDPVVVTLLTVYIVVSAYHLTYDQLLLYVGPLTALGVLVEGRTATPASRFLTVGGVGLAVIELLLRPGFRSRFVDGGAPAVLVHSVWVIAPTLITLMLVAAAMMIGFNAERDKRLLVPGSPTVA